MHCTASGKLFIASMAPAERDALIEHATLTRMTPKTIFDEASPAIVRVEAGSEKIGTGHA